MKKRIEYLNFIVAIICITTNAFALEFKAGQYFFDNTKLHFDNVKFVIGNKENASSTVFEMTKLEDKDWWVVQLNQDFNDIDSYCFICGDIAPGCYNISPDSLMISVEDSTLRRTQMFPIDPSILPNWVSTGWIFYPINNSSISNGYWRTINSYEATPSMTVPVVHINTEGAVPITSKDYYLNGTLWIEDEQQCLGTIDSPLIIEIKGRGNWTWNFLNKKPYKIKFASKQAPLGLDKSKHFILMPNAGDYSGYMRNETGFELSRQFGMPYTTRQTPVELVLNDEYEGIYFLCEKIRVESGRVDIIEQEDNDNNPYNVTGGWLLELAYEDNIVIQQFENNDPSNSWISFKSNSPEELSQVQRDYIHDFIFRGDSCIHVADKSDCAWEQHFDINTLARFYVIHEIMENVEAFSGSLFMYKDWGENEKLKFGPVWDFDNSSNPSHNTNCDHFIFEYDTQFQFVWIRELLKFPHFQQKIRQVWKEFKSNDILCKINEHAAQWRSLIIAAEASDKIRWELYASNHSSQAPAEYLDKISRKVAWLDEQWSVPAADVNCDGTVSAVDVTIIYNYLLNGDETYKSSCDVNGDGIISSVDITEIYNILLGN